MKKMEFASNLHKKSQEFDTGLPRREIDTFVANFSANFYSENLAKDSE